MVINKNMFYKTATKRVKNLPLAIQTEFKKIYPQHFLDYKHLHLLSYQNNAMNDCIEILAPGSGADWVVRIRLSNNECCRPEDVINGPAIYRFRFSHPEIKAPAITYHKSGRFCYYEAEYKKKIYYCFNSSEKYEKVFDKRAIFIKNDNNKIKTSCLVSYNRNVFAIPAQHIGLTNDEKKQLKSFKAAVCV